jgi:hypothetical protein
MKQISKRSAEQLNIEPKGKRSDGHGRGEHTLLTYSRNKQDEFPFI